MLFKAEGFCVQKEIKVYLFTPFLHQHVISSKFDQQNPFAQRNVGIPIVTETNDKSETDYFEKPKMKVGFLFIFKVTYQANLQWIISQCLILKEFLLN